jgi:DNA-binding response OmpR family regulator
MNQEQGRAPEAMILGPSEMIEPAAERALADAGYRVRRPADLAEGMLIAFRCPLELLVIGHEPPRTDAALLVPCLRRSRDCTSRRAQIWVVLDRIEESDLAAMRDAGCSQLALAPLAAERVSAMIAAMKADKRSFVERSAYAGPDRRVQQLTTFGFVLKRAADHRPRTSGYSARLPAVLVKQQP